MGNYQYITGPNPQQVAQLDFHCSAASNGVWILGSGWFAGCLSV
jgi:hypothetical protein